MAGRDGTVGILFDAGLVGVSVRDKSLLSERVIHLGNLEVKLEVF